MNIEDVFTFKPGKGGRKPFDFILVDKRKFTAIQVIRNEPLFEGGHVFTYTIWEVHLAPGVQHYSEFDEEIVEKNISRLTDEYLNFAENHCTEKLKEEYSDYLNNSQEYEMWTELLYKIQTEIKLRKEGKN